MKALAEGQSWLPDGVFATVIRHTPLVSMDLLVRDPVGHVLLGERLRRPARGSWFVPGGRIRKGEPLAAAFRRLCRDELGCDLSLADATFRGVYEHHYDDHVFGDDFGTHYVVLAYELHLDLTLASLPGEQHGDYRWWRVEDLVSDTRVHVHSQWYFQSDTPCAVRL